MTRTLDTITRWCATLAAALLFAIGMLITYEVIARYVFNAPTSWAEEIARFFQIWAVYLAVAWVLRGGDLITITVLVDRLGPRTQVVARGFALSVMLIFSVIAIWYGSAIALESVEVQRRTSTMLGLPQWITEIAIPIGFTLFALQLLAEAMRLPGAWRDARRARGDAQA